MNARMLCSRVLVIVGSIAMLIGAIDPLEGSLIILPGSGMVALGTLLSKSRRGVLLYWVCVFVLIAVGVGALWGVSELGGIGGGTGRSMWWALAILPYPIGWMMGFAGLILKLIDFLKVKVQRVQS